MINSIGYSIAGLSVHSTKVNTAAHNVANVNTAEYKKDRVTIQSNESGLPEDNIDKINTPGHMWPYFVGVLEMSNVNLAEEMVNMSIGKIGFMANLKVLQTQDEMEESVLDILA